MRVELNPRTFGITEPGVKVTIETNDVFMLFERAQDTSRGRSTRGGVMVTLPSRNRKRYRITSTVHEGNPAVVITAYSQKSALDAGVRKLRRDYGMARPGSDDSYVRSVTIEVLDE